MSIICEDKETYYFGEVKNKKPHGLGELLCRPKKKDGFSYMGNFVEGIMQGKAEQKIGKNLFYKGDFENDFK